MRVVINKEGAVTVVKPMGSLVSGELEDMELHLHQLTQNGVKRIIINMTEVTCIDSAGLEIINRCRKQLDQRGLRLKLCNMNELTRNIFDLTRLAPQFEIFPDTAAAVRSFL